MKIRLATGGDRPFVLRLVSSFVAFGLAGGDAATNERAVRFDERLGYEPDVLQLTKRSP